MGCVDRPNLQSPAAKWRAADSTLEEHLNAAGEICPLGTTAAAAKNLLGEEGLLVHHHGLTVRGDDADGNSALRRTSNHDYWAIEYQFAAGEVCLLLKWEGGQATLENAVVTNITVAKRIPLKILAPGNQ